MGGWVDNNVLPAELKNFKLQAYATKETFNNIFFWPWILVIRILDPTIAS